MITGRCRVRMALVLAACAAGAAIAAGAHAPAPPAVDVVLPPSRAVYQERIERAAAESLTQYHAWLGPLPADRLTMTATGHPVAADAARPIALDLPWRAAEPMMEVESAVAFALALEYWPHDPEHASFARGLSWYLQSHIVERLFNLRFSRPGHSTDGLRLFGGYVPWSLPGLRFSRWSNGLGDEPAAVAFAALERYLSWPVMQGALRSLAASMPDSKLTPAQASRVIGAAAGQDLAWFFDAAFAPGARVDYALTGLASVRAGGDCPPEGCFQTRVTVERRGAALFTGSSRPVLGTFESGSGIGVRVSFADGTAAEARWDGRARDRVFEFVSAAPAVMAELNPDGSLLLDPTPLDHVRYLTPHSNMPRDKWVARWMLWLQDAMLTWGMIV